jgi:prefoldin alpha subunit
MMNANIGDDKYQQLQILEYQIKQLEKILDSVGTQLSEINNTIEALKEFGRLNINTEILFPVANGIFAKGKLSDNKLLNINIGSDVNIEKSVEDTILMMMNQAKDIEAYKEEIDVQLQKFIDKMNELQVGE